MALPTQDISAAIFAAASPAELRGGVANGSIAAMNWAAWEATIQRKKRLEQWRLNGGRKKVVGSRRTIYDTRQRIKVRCPPLDQYQWFTSMPVKGGVTAAEVQIKSQAFGKSMAALMATMQEFWTHQMDAMLYATMMHGGIKQQAKHRVKINPKRLKLLEPYIVHDEIYHWHDEPRFALPEYHERALTWQVSPELVRVSRNLTNKALIASGPSPSVTSLNARGPSGRVQSWKMPGGRSKTPSASTA